MDGSTRGVTGSLRARLSLWLSVFVLAAGTLTGALSFWLALGEARELQDEQLRQVARLALNEHLSPAPPVPQDGAHGSPDGGVRIIPLSDSQRAGGGMLFAPSTIADGMHTLRQKGKSWRVFVVSGAPGVRVAVAQPTEVRDRAAVDDALSTLLPLIALIPVLLILIRFVVHSNLAQLVQLAAMLDKRSEDNLTPLPEALVLEEIHPFVAAINRLLERLRCSLEHKRRFIADAAHELRTPLTALSLQARNLENAASLAEVRRRIVPLKQGLERARQLAEQLISLARQSESFPAALEAVRLDLVALRVVEEMLPVAERTGVDLGVEQVQAVEIEGDEFAVYTMLRNVVDNAVRYTTGGGKASLRVFTQGSTAVMEVEDTGPGIREEDLDKVFEPFFRLSGAAGSGSGLGLAIVKSIADKYGFRVSLRNVEDGAGLRFRVETELTAVNRQAVRPGQQHEYPRPAGRDERSSERGDRRLMNAGGPRLRQVRGS